MRASLILAGLLIAAPVRAAELVIHAGDASEVRKLVAERAKLDEGTLNAMSLDQVLAGLSRPALMPQGSVETCQGVSYPLEAFAEALSNAEGDVLYMDYDKAIEGLGKVERVLPCLVGVPAQEDLARAWFLQGFANGMKGHDTEAREAFARALAADPDIAWDPNFPTTPQPILEEQRAATGARARLTILPPAGGSVFVDGVAVEGDGSPLLLAPGPHLVQVDQGGISSLRIYLETEKVHQLALSGSVSSGVLSWAGDPDLRPALEAVLAAVRPAGSQVYVVSGDMVISGKLGGEWTALNPAWIDPEQRNAELREAMAALRVKTAVDFFSTDIELWITSPGQARSAIAPEQELLLPLGDSLLEASWDDQQARFPLVVPETPAVIAALQRHRAGADTTESLLVGGSKLPLPWALAVKVGEETVSRELHPGTKSEAFVSLDLPLPVEGEPKVHVAGSVLGVPGSVRTLHLDPSQHPAIPLYDALEAARSIKRKDFWIAPVGVALGAGLGAWAGISWSQATTLAAEAREMEADPELVDAYNQKVDDAEAAQLRSWLTGGGAAASLVLGVGYEVSFGGKKRRQVTEARAAWNSATAEPVDLDALTVDWQ